MAGNPKLTVDYGLRWDFYPPATPKVDGGFSNYNPTNNTLELAGIGDNPSNLGMETQYKHFAPRTGLSYRASEDTVIRAGFGMSYIPFTDNTYAYNYPIRANNSYQPAGSTFTPAVLSDGATVATFHAVSRRHSVTIPDNGIIPANTPSLISQAYTYIPKNFRYSYGKPGTWPFISLRRQLHSANCIRRRSWLAHDLSQNINLPSVYGGGNASLPENSTAFTAGATGRTAATNQFFLGASSNYNALQVQLTQSATPPFSRSPPRLWARRSLRHRGR